MKRTLLALLFLVAIAYCGRAQYVNIPDIHFGTWLRNHGYSTCMTGNVNIGWRLDTTCNKVLTDTLLSVTFQQNITDITGVRYFKGLKELNCGTNSLVTLPELPPNLLRLYCINQVDSHNFQTLTSLGSSLPDSIRIIYCNANMLTSLPPLPPYLQVLHCQDCQLSSLPSLPNTITEIWCTSNYMTSLPALPTSLFRIDCDINILDSLPALPYGLHTLRCDLNHITHLPTLPSSLRYLYAGSNLLTSLPALPDSLGYVDCSINQLTSLPALPPLLGFLSCSSNQLNSLPALPMRYMSNLYCSSNQLSSLPALPPNLQTLYCDHNMLTDLPALPTGIYDLRCNDNPALSCLPRIYRSILGSFYIANTNIHCLPDRFSLVIPTAPHDANPDTLPLCTPGSGCDFYYNIAGNVHRDTAATCVQDSLHPGNALHSVKVQLLQGGTVVQQFYTFGGGGYSFLAANPGSYDVALESLPGLQIACPAGGVHHVALSAADSLEPFRNFGMTCGATDFFVQSIVSRHFRPGFTNHVMITAGNRSLINNGAACGGGIAGTVTTTLSGAMAYTGPAAGALTPSSVSGNTLTYAVTDLNSLQVGSLDIMLAVDSQAVLGSQVCITTTISPSVPDADSSDNALTQCFELVNSFDPNVKAASPIATVDTGRQWLTYTIQFQNTGTDTARTVVVKDTLSQYVDASSFQYLASSHHAVIQLFGNAMVFTFPKINLVDSVHNEPLSHGWIQYRVKTNANLPIGTQIQNTASIYFDLNPAIVTNTTTNTVAAAASCANVYAAFYDTICDGTYYQFGNSYYVTGGTYYDTVPISGGCDSFKVLYLYSHPAINVSMGPSTYNYVCSGTPVSLGGRPTGSGGTGPLGYYWNGSQTISNYFASNPTDVVTSDVVYIVTVTDSLGCTAMATDTFVVMSSVSANISHTICNGSGYNFGGRTLTAAGVYTDTLTAIAGCDSIVTLTLAVNAALTGAYSHAICSGSSYTFGRRTLTQAGTYRDTLTNGAGCDSIVTLTLTVNASPVVGLSWDSLARAHVFFSSTIDTILFVCSTGHTPGSPTVFALAGGVPAGGVYSGTNITNDTFRFDFIHGQNRHNIIYYTYTDSGGCSSIAVDSFVSEICEGIDDVNPAQIIHLYPNPNSGTFTLETSQQIGTAYVIYDMLGQIVQEKSITSDKQHIDMGNAAAGVYTLMLKGRSGAVRIVVR